MRKEFTVTDGKVAALKRLDLEVAEGEFFVIVGASGSGKTTLLRCVAGLETPEGGEIRVDDRTVFGEEPPVWVPPQDRNFGMVFQSYAVWPHLTVFDNVELPLREGARKIPRRQVHDRVREALHMAQIDEHADRPSTLLSGGQQQRVALARAIAVNPGPGLLVVRPPLPGAGIVGRSQRRPAPRHAPGRCCRVTTRWTPQVPSPSSPRPGAASR